MKTRIDILSGQNHRGKAGILTTLQGSVGSRFTGAAVVRCASAAALPSALALHTGRPGRVLLELPGDVTPSRLPALLAEAGTLDRAFLGTVAFVADGSAFLRRHFTPRDYYEEQIRNAAVVFLTGAEALDPARRLAAMGRIWEINRRVHLMVEPLHGMDLWNVFDLPAAPGNTTETARSI